MQTQGLKTSFCREYQNQPTGLPAATVDGLYISDTTKTLREDTTLPNVVPETSTNQFPSEIFFHQNNDPRRSLDPPAPQRVTIGRVMEILS